MNIIADGELFYYDAETYPVDYNYWILNYSGYRDSKRFNGWGKRFAVNSDLFLNRQHSLILNARYDQWLDDYMGMTKIDAYGYYTFALRYSLTPVPADFEENIMNRIMKD